MAKETPVALVTGATSGIGCATATAFAKRGDRVVFTGRRQELGKKLELELRGGGGEATFVEADVGVEDASRRAVAAALDTYGRLDFAFNNAGIEGELGPVTELSETNIERTFRTNVMGVLFGMKYQVAAMKEAGGSIVNNASIAGMVGMPGTTVYAASKGAVLAATRAVAQESAALGVRVNAISPAGTHSDAFDRFFNHDEAAIAGFAQQHALGRIAEPEEMASVVLWLCGVGASFVTGQNIVADGGYTTR